MKWNTKLVILVLSMACVPKAHSSGYYLTNSQIEYLTITASTAYFRGKGTADSNPDGCIKSDYAMLSDSHGKFQATYSMLLAAQSAQKNVKVYVDGCHNGYPKVATVHLLN